MNINYINSDNTLLSFLKYYSSGDKLTYDLIWLILAYGLPIQTVINIQKKHISKDFILKMDDKYLEPVDVLLLNYLPDCLLESQSYSAEDYLIFSRKYRTKRQGPTLTRSRCSTILNNALKLYSPSFDASSLRRTYLFFYLKNRKTLVGSSYEYLQFRHKKLLEILFLTEEKYQELITKKSLLSNPDIDVLKMLQENCLKKAALILENSNKRSDEYQLTKKFISESKILSINFLSFFDTADNNTLDISSDELA